MYVCKAGHMAVRKAQQGKKGVAANQVDSYYFDIEKCKHAYKEQDAIRKMPKAIVIQ